MSSIRGIILRILYSFTACAIAILLIVFSAIILYSLQNETDKYNQMLDNWNNSPIVSIYPISRNETCSYGDTSIFAYEWLGTKEGCLCQSTKSVSNKPCCSSKNSDSRDCCNGVPIKASQKLNVDSWGFFDNTNNIPSNNILKLCSKRLTQYNFRKNSPRSLECLENEQWCGFDQKGNKDADTGFCVDKKYKCPINEIIFSQKKLDLDIYEEVVLPGNIFTKLYISRKAQKRLPLSEFSVSPNFFVCANKYRQASLVQGYPLDNRDQTCGFSDFLFERANISLSEKDFFSVNKINTVVEQLPEFKYSSDTYKLFSKTYINLKMNCRGDIENFYSYSDHLEKVEKLATIIFALCLTYAFEIFFFESWIGFCYPKYSWGVVIFRRKVNTILKLIYILKFCLIIACNVTLIMQLYFYSRQSNFLERNISGECLDKYTKDNFENLQSNMKSDLIFITFFFLWVLILIEPNVGYLLGKCCGCDCKNNSDQKNGPPVKSNKNLNNAMNNVNENQQVLPLFVITHNINPSINQMPYGQYNNAQFYQQQQQQQQQNIPQHLPIYQVQVADNN